MTQLKVQRDFGWIFRPQFLSDKGIDAHIEIGGIDELPRGRLIGLQIKAGPSWFKERDEDGFIYRGSYEHLDYWLDHSLPVLLVLCNIDEDICYWIHVTEEAVERLDKGWKICVPERNVLEPSAATEIKRIAENTSDFERRLSYLQVQRSLMMAAQSEDDLILEAEEWVNKLSGQGSLRLSLRDPYSLETKIVRDWPLVLLGSEPYERLFPKIFPWAQFSIDEDEYEDCDAEKVHDLYGYVDAETFYEWRNDQPDIRPYYEDGEVARYQLFLTLNELGTAYLTIDSYLNSGPLPWD